MAHITSIGAGMFSDLAVSTPSVNPSAATLAGYDTASEFQALFVTEIPSVGGVKAVGTFVRIKGVREFPAMGTPPNVVNVPVFGQKTSSQIQGQSDAPSWEIKINYISAEWAREAANILGSMVGDGIQYVFRFTLMNAKPASYDSAVAGLGSVQNSQYYWVGKLEALMVEPQLTDANQATLTLTLQSEFFGPYTV